jgi:hypothetical protein
MSYVHRIVQALQFKDFEVGGPAVDQIVGNSHLIDFRLKRFAMLVPPSANPYAGLTVSARAWCGVPPAVTGLSVAISNGKGSAF